MNHSPIIAIFTAVMLLIFLQLTGYAQEGAEGSEEITVGFAVPEVGSIILPAYINEKEELYLPIAEVFSYLRIRIDTFSHALLLSGYLFDESKTYRIDGAAHTIELAGKEHQFTPDELLLTEGRIYLRSDLFGTLFGLRCAFDFGNLEVDLATDYELPAVREAKREKARRALHKLYEPESFDHSIAGDGAVLRLGVVDWSVAGGLDSLGKSDLSYGVNFGGELLGGAIEIGLKGKNDSLMGLEDIPVRWKRVDNDFAPARQITLGKVASMLPEPLASSALGASITNRSTISRTTYGAYTIQDQTEPGWEVELYVEDQLVDFTTADASGLYTFQIPFRYGSTDLTLRFFGPWGEEETMKKTLRIPLTMLPAGEVEYSVVGGLLDGEGSGLFTHAKGEVGINSILTLGGGIYGVQYNAPKTWYPYLTGAMRLSNVLFLSGKYSPETGGEGFLNWIMPNRGSLEFSYQRAPHYVQPQIGGDIVQNAKEVVEKRSLSIATPIPFGGTAQMRIVDNLNSFGHSLQGEGTLTTRLFGYPLTLEARGEWVGHKTWGLASFRTGARTLIRPWQLVSLRPSIEIDMRTRQVTSGRLEAERQIVSGMWASVTVAHDFGVRKTSMQFGLRLDLPFARTGMAARYENGGVAFNASASGSIAYDNAGGSFVAEDRGQLDRAALTVRPFLDLNANDTMDAGEPLVPEMEVAINGGIVRRSASDSTIHVLGLEPYQARILRVDESSLPEISWKPKYKTWKVTPRPNRFQTIDVPIVVVGEVSGKITRGSEGGGMQGLLVRFRQLDGTFSDSTLTFDGGEFYFMGLPPGHYSASLDETQIRILGLNPEATSIEFEVKPGREGDIVEGVTFRIKSNVE